MPWHHTCEQVNKTNFMNNEDQQNRQAGGGSGSAENMGKDRSAQQANQTEGAQNKTPQSIDESVPVGNLRDMGALSGRDDASGGSGDGMENTNSSEPTERF